MSLVFLPLSLSLSLFRARRFEASRVKPPFRIRETRKIKIVSGSRWSIYPESHAAIHQATRATSALIFFGGILCTSKFLKIITLSTSPHNSRRAEGFIRECSRIVFNHDISKAFINSSSSNDESSFISILGSDE